LRSFAGVCAGAWQCGFVLARRPAGWRPGAAGGCGCGLGAAAAVAAAGMGGGLALVPAGLGRGPGLAQVAAAGAC